MIYSWTIIWSYVVGWLWRTTNWKPKASDHCEYTIYRLVFKLLDAIITFIHAYPLDKPNWYSYPLSHKFSAMCVHYTLNRSAIDLLSHEVFTDFSCSNGLDGDVIRKFLLMVNRACQQHPHHATLDWDSWKTLGKSKMLSFRLGHVNEYPTIHYFGNPKRTQSMIAYMILTEHSWKFSWNNALWECC